MGNVLLKPNLSVPNIVVKDVNKNDNEGANSIKNTWGVRFPLIEINGFLIPSGGLRNFKLSYTLNKLPLLSFEIEDSLYEFRRKIISKKIDKGVVFLGFPELYIKFNFIILNLPNDYGGNFITIRGVFYNEKLYESEQKLYENKTPLDIFKDLCSISGMGLFSVNSEKLNKIIPLEINANQKNIKFFETILKKHTTAIYSVDGNGYIHIGEVEKLREMEVEKYQWKEGKKLTKPQPIILTNKRKTDDSDEVNDTKIYFDFYGITNNHGLEHTITTKTYTVNDDTAQKIINKSIDYVGVGDTSLNTFKDFTPTYNGGEFFYNNVVGKDLSGKVIDVDMIDICLEITPFSVVSLELYLPKLEGMDAKIDEENSGKKIVIGIEYIFEQSEGINTALPRTKQRLFLL